MENLASLSEEQRCIVDLARAGKSFCFGGEPGTGKSYVLRVLRQVMAAPTTYFTASTALAALNISESAMTVHQQTGIGIADKPATYYFAVYKGGKNQIMRTFWDTARTLVIDEISMLSKAAFDVLDQLGRLIRKRPHVPFGGLQVITSGDFLQLGPIPPKGQREAPYVFEARAWNQSMSMHLELSENHRQRGDLKFQALLGEMRWAAMSPATCATLVSRESARLLAPRGDSSSSPSSTNAAAAGPASYTSSATTTTTSGSGGGGGGGFVTNLHSLNVDVERDNEAALNKLSGAVKLFLKVDEIGFPADVRELDQICNAPHKLVLKLGAAVLGVVNSAKSQDLKNGNAGEVIAFAASTGNPIVRWVQSGRSEEIAPHQWKVFDEVDRNRVRSFRKQIPLRLGYALTCHRIQGMTLGRIKVHMARMFTYAQFYVSCSRARRLCDLQLDRFDASKVFPIPDRVFTFQRRFVRVRNYLEEQQRQQLLSSPVTSSAAAAAAGVPSKVSLSPPKI